MIETNVFHIETDTLKLGLDNSPYFIQSDDSGVLKFFSGVANSQNLIKVDNGIFQTTRLFIDGFNGQSNVVVSGRFGELLESNVSIEMFETYDNRIKLLETPVVVDTENLIVSNISGKFSNIVHFKSNVSAPVLNTNIIRPGGEAAGVTCEGNIICRNVFTDFVYSDERLKKNVRPLDPAMSRKILESLRAVRFDHIDDMERDVPGFIAQEVRNLDPSLVGQRPDGFLYIKFERLVPHIIQILQESRQE